MVPVIIVNGLLGALCGVWFRVQIFIPLIAVAAVEVAIIKLAGTGWSVLWSAIALICSLEVGYLIGSTVSTLAADRRPRKLSARLHALRNWTLSQH